MKKVFCIYMLLFALVIGLQAENSKSMTEGKEVKEETAVAAYSLKGVVVDTEMDEALAGVSITVDGKKYYSDLSGNFEIPSLLKGKHQVAVDFISYQSKLVEVDLDKDEELYIEIRRQ
ncbi:MAG: carboxypeptidase-like regulatory domain-containing protein [Tannerellaceae bacterium]|nr:carboxypeptidase-like regulatory domain-containing protein [Tannerellaceae bacterium]